NRVEVESRFRFSFLFEHDLVRPGFARRSVEWKVSRLGRLRAGGKPVSTFSDHALGDDFTLCRREAAIKRLAFICHVDKKLRWLEPLPASFGEIVAHLDEILHTHAVNVRNGSTGKRCKTEAENRTDIGFAHVGDDPLLDATRRFQRLNAEEPAFERGNIDVV